jgi:alkylhydroperoxidase family enzyme
LDETQLAARVLDIALVNMWNRLNIATRQISGDQALHSQAPAAT